MNILIQPLRWVESLCNNLKFQVIWLKYIKKLYRYNNLNAIIFQRWYSVTLFTGTALPLRYGFFYSYILTLWFTESPIRLCLSWEASTWRCPKKTYILLQTVPLHTFFYVYGQDAWGLPRNILQTHNLLLYQKLKLLFY